MKDSASRQREAVYFCFYNVEEIRIKNLTWFSQADNAKDAVAVFFSNLAIIITLVTLEAGFASTGRLYGSGIPIEGADLVIPDQLGMGLAETVEPFAGGSMNRLVDLARACIRELIQVQNQF